MVDSRVSTYQEIEIFSMTPGGRVVFLYGHLLGKLEKARRSTEAEFYQEALVGAQDTVAELMGSLNAEAGGEIAANLCSLYSFFLRELIALVNSRSDQRLAKLIDLITSLKAAWDIAATQPTDIELAQ